MVRKRKIDFGSVVAGIYEGVIEPARWAEAVTRIALATGTERFALAPIALVAPPALPLTVHPDVAEPLRKFYSIDVANPFTQAVTSRRLTEGQVVTREMVLDDRTWHRSEVYNEVVHPAGLEEIGMVVVHCGLHSQVDRTFLAILKEQGQPGFTPTELRTLRALTPHLQRAAELHRRLARGNCLARAALDALDRLPCGVLLVGSTGWVLHANIAGEAMLGRSDGLAVRYGNLVAADPKHTARLHGLIAEAIHALQLDPPSSGGAMLLPRPSGLPAWQVTVSPLAPNNPYSVGPAHAAALLILTDPNAEIRAPDAMLHALFGFTPAEARVALALANGATPQQIAERYQLSLLTVRTHIRHLHDKLGVRNLGQLLHRVLQVAGVVHTAVGRDREGPGA